MKKQILLGTLALLTGSLLAANAAPKDEITAAAKKLADKDNYAWKQKSRTPAEPASAAAPPKAKPRKMATSGSR